MSLPIIDISPLSDAAGSGGGARLTAVARQIDEACRTWGFFYIVGHGIPQARLDALTALARRFFALPLEEKLRIDVTKSGARHRGYGAARAEQLDPAHSTDHKETFDMNCHLPESHPEVVAGAPLRGPNVHPEGIPGWAETLEAHYADMQGVALRLLRALAIAIGADDENFFVDKFHEPLSGFRLIHYPALSPQQRAEMRAAEATADEPSAAQVGEQHEESAHTDVGSGSGSGSGGTATAAMATRPRGECPVVCGEHTDYGIVTLLYQADASGLQVRDLKGEWMDVPIVPGSVVVNIGDMMAMWSNDRYRSTPHRVLNSGVDRISMPFFTEPNPAVVVSCLPNCSSADDPARYPPVTAGEWLRRRFEQTYAYRREKQ